jgi:hypothetical protein
VTKDFGAARSEHDTNGVQAVNWLLPASVARLTRTRMKMSEFDLAVPDLYKTELTIRANGSSSTLPFKAAWGMTPDDVRKLSTSIESADAGPRGTILNALAEVAGQKAKLSYHFAEDKLWKIEYRFTTDHPDRNLFVKDSEAMQEYLDEKYGDHVKADTKWRDTLFSNDTRSWGLAVSRGDLTFTSVWRTPESEITLLLSGGSLKLSLLLTFESRALSLVMEQSEQAEAQPTPEPEDTPRGQPEQLQAVGM